MWVEENGSGISFASVVKDSPFKLPPFGDNIGWNNTVGDKPLKPSPFRDNADWDTIKRSSWGEGQTESINQPLVSALRRRLREEDYLKNTEQRLKRLEQRLSSRSSTSKPVRRIRPNNPFQSAASQKFFSQFLPPKNRSKSVKPELNVKQFFLSTTYYLNNNATKTVTIGWRPETGEAANFVSACAFKTFVTLSASELTDLTERLHDTTDFFPSGVKPKYCKFPIKFSTIYGVKHITIKNQDRSISLNSDEWSSKILGTPATGDIMRKHRGNAVVESENVIVEAETIAEHLGADFNMPRVINQ
ncbi:hypothetical protein J437_LFUL018248 [Ladona fulva]|uniref:Uncharacterized protein n=1 Tax=Ladona fulva TaxID=123851 RepID=A0A8K0KQX8_LADFU|nr:hypothetical protein J437_LFUL018248 [Ladona fulva]